MVYDSSDAGVRTLTVNKPDIYVHSVPSEASASNTATTKSIAGSKVGFTQCYSLLLCSLHPLIHVGSNT